MNLKGGVGLLNTVNMCSHMETNIQITIGCDGRHVIVALTILGYGIWKEFCGSK